MRLNQHTCSRLHMVQYSDINTSMRFALYRLEALSDDQQMTFALRLVERHSGTEKTVTTHLLRLEILKTLRELGKHAPTSTNCQLHHIPSKITIIGHFYLHVSFFHAGVCCQEVLFAVLPILTDSNVRISFMSLYSNYFCIE